MKRIVLSLCITILLLNIFTINTYAAEKGQVNIVLDLPQDFGLTVRAVLWNTDNNDETEVYLYQDNNYQGMVKLIPGNYQLAEVTVVNDYTGQYLFENAQEFELKANQTVTIEPQFYDYSDKVDNTVDMVTQTLSDEEEEDNSTSSGNASGNANNENNSKTFFSFGPIIFIGLMVIVIVIKLMFSSKQDEGDYKLKGRR